MRHLGLICCYYETGWSSNIFGRIVFCGFDFGHLTELQFFLSVWMQFSWNLLYQLCDNSVLKLLTDSSGKAEQRCIQCSMD